MIGTTGCNRLRCRSVHLAGHMGVHLRGHLGGSCDRHVTPRRGVYLRHVGLRSQVTPLLWGPGDQAAHGLTRVTERSVA